MSPATRRSPTSRTCTHVFFAEPECHEYECQGHLSQGTSRSPPSSPRTGPRYRPGQCASHTERADLRGPDRAAASRSDGLLPVAHHPRSSACEARSVPRSDELETTPAIAALCEGRSAGEVQRHRRPSGVELAKPDDRAVRREALDLHTALAQMVKRRWVRAHLR
jgi:hypothetical protein